jgi:hypothetical protein
MEGNMPRHIMAPPDSDQQPQRRGLMTPDPAHAGQTPDLRNVLWFVAVVVLLVELVLNALG